MKAGALALLFPVLAFAGDPLKGKEIALARVDGNCLLCHAIPGAERPAGDIGPALDGVGRRLSLAAIRSLIVDASRFNPASVMPPYGRTEGLHSVAPQYRGKPLLTDEQIDDLAAFLATLK